MKNEIDSYMKELNKELCLPKKIKKSIIAELQAEIHCRMEDGEELRSILCSIGTPQKVAEEVQANYEHEYIQLKKGSILKLIIYSIVAFGVAVLIIYSLIMIVYPQFVLPAIIGGTKGSSSVFVALKWSKKELTAGLIVQIMIFAFVALQIMRLFKLLVGEKGAQ